MRFGFGLTLTVLIAQGAHAEFTADAVYRGDTRLEISEVKDPMVLRLADATVSVFELKNLKHKGDSYHLDTTPMSQKMGICESEKFADQPSASECSGVLIAPDQVLTAGHCVSKKTCKKMAFAFGYSNINGVSPDRLPSEEVYFCKDILSRSNTNSLDYAVIELDRTVANHEPVKMSEARISVGEPVFLLSHPAGTPLKYSQPNSVLSSTNNVFVAEIDALGGSSGGPVFSATSHELVGILVAGEEDYVQEKKKGCRKILHCKPGRCLGEESTHIARILEDVQ